MNKTRRNQTMNQNRIKIVIFLSLFGFSLGIMAITLHHHDNAFSLPTCSICIVKTSLSGAFGKINVDSAPAIAIWCLSMSSIFLCLSGILPDGKNICVDFQTAGIYSNKAPPFKF